MKKLFATILAVLTVITCAFSLVACNDSEDPMQGNLGIPTSGIPLNSEIAAGKMLNLGYTVHLPLITEQEKDLYGAVSGISVYKGNKEQRLAAIWFISEAKAKEYYDTGNINPSLDVIVLNGKVVVGGNEQTYRDFIGVTELGKYTDIHAPQTVQEVADKMQSLEYDTTIATDVELLAMALTGRDGINGCVTAIKNGTEKYILQVWFFDSEENAKKAVDMWVSQVTDRMKLSGKMAYYGDYQAIEQMLTIYP